MRATVSVLASALLLLPLASAAGGEAGEGPRVGTRGGAAHAAQGEAGAAEGTAAPAPGADEGTVAFEVVRGGTVTVPAGEYTPLYGADGALVMPAFALDRRPVTRAEFAAFVDAHPAWRRDRVKGVFTDAGYLASWPAADDYGGALDGARPVTEVSWFAARAYCEAQGQRLPTVDEWEHAAGLAPEGTEAGAWKAEVLAAGGSRARGMPGPVGTGVAGAAGLRDQHGLVQEWTMDFNTAVVSSDSRGTGARDRGLYCASSASGASDTSDYAAFLRYAFRASVDGRTTTRNLGFRCAGG